MNLFWQRTEPYTVTTHGRTEVWEPAGVIRRADKIRPGHSLYVPDLAQVVLPPGCRPLMSTGSEPYYTVEGANYLPKAAYIQGQFLTGPVVGVRFVQGRVTITCYDLAAGSRAASLIQEVWYDGEVEYLDPILAPFFTSFLTTQEIRANRRHKAAA